ncbi:DUF779 domain-containing protein [Leucobacter triazinivorans]|uniref:DUF779 domain-containing protein n=1 Tax=Leucobacter triazinivorans TaxID=1784719 RepID=A0A4P6KJS8_9MICO|nr:DUF779 domain-containing protein [Leucobacter triazinivorans]QBE49884.1 DUF779 domain-containing protein [Leucobacter triazinivorans]
MNEKTADACDLPAAPPAPAGSAAIPGCVDARPDVAGETASRLAFTPAALELIDRLWALHGPLMFHQSGGCCDGSAPMCYQEGEFRTGGQDVLLGTLELPATTRTGEPGASAAAGDADDTGATREIGFWMSREQFQVWAHTHLTVDAVPGRGSGFSLEAPEGMRFLIRSRLL